jgi:urea carboxylase-associated protein 2
VFTIQEGRLSSGNTAPPTEIDPVAPEMIIADDTVAAGAYWTRVIPRGATLRITDVEGAGAAALLAYNADATYERYNAPDTTKVQNMVFLTTGWVLLSDLGRVLLSITGDTCGDHETLSGGTTAGTILARYGPGTYYDRRNERFTNDRDNFIAALGRHGLDRRDLVPNVNLFARVEVGDDGTLTYVPGRARPGSWIDLRAELNVLVALSATPHVLNPLPTFRAGPLRVTVWSSPPPAPDDPCRTRSDEASRAFANTDAWFAEHHAPVTR